MSTITQVPPNVAIFSIPDPPEEFGQDGGNFYKTYDTLAERMDEDMTNSLKEQLDGMLIFAGLFAGVNTAFLALTLPLLSPDPANDTNALLAHNSAILMQLVSGRNDSSLTPLTLPSTSFAPSSSVVSVNVLFTLSLAFAIISSFLAVMGRQWLVYYRKYSGGSQDSQRWEQVGRLLGIERWRLGLILDDILPSLLQGGLIIFSISLLIYLHSLNSTLSNVVGVPLYLGLGFFIGSAACTIWDKFCPFHSPLSHFLKFTLTSAPRSTSDTPSPVKNFLPLDAVSSIPRWFTRQRVPVFRTISFHWMKPTTRRLAGPFTWVYGAFIDWLDHSYQGQRAEDRESLQVIAIQRTICTSEELPALIYAVTNILAISKVNMLKMLWDNETFRERFLELRDSLYTAASELRGHDHFDFAASAARLCWCAASHILIHVGSEEHDLDYFNNFGFEAYSNSSILRISRDKLAHSSPVMIRASLVSSALSTFWDFKSSEEQRDFYNHLDEYSRKGGDLGLVSLVLWMIARLERVANPWLFSPTALESLIKSYPGDLKITLENFASAHGTVLDPDNWDQIDRYGIMTIMLRCAEHLIAAGRGHGSTELIELKDRFRVLGCCEVALRTSATPQDENLQIMRRIRADTLTEIKNLLSDPENRPEHIPSMFLDSLATYFQALVSADRSTSHLLQDGWLDIFDTFAPLIHQLWSYSPASWEKCDHSRWCDVTGDLRMKRDAACQAFNTYVLTVDKACCPMKHGARLVRDPEVSWCQFSHEPSSVCIAAKYCLPPDEGSNS